MASPPYPPLPKRVRRHAWIQENQRQSPPKAPSKEVVNSAPPTTEKDDEHRDPKQSVETTVQSLEDTLHRVTERRRSTMLEERQRRALLKVQESKGLLPTSPEELVQKTAPPGKERRSTAEQGVRRRTRVTLQPKMKRSPSSSRPSSATYLDSKAREELRRDKAIRRDERMVTARKRRDDIEKDKVKKLANQTGSVRRARLNKERLEKRAETKRLQNLCVCVVLASRFKAWGDTITSIRAEKERVIARENASRIITRQMRLYAFRCHRRRVRSAIQVITFALVVKIRLWKKSRLTVAADRVSAFLVALEKENKKSGGCLALIVQGKKWRAYRKKIINVQRLWRRKQQITEAQTVLIDSQWQREQERITDEEVERLFKEGEKATREENERIDAMNRTRKLLKMKPLQPKKLDSRAVVREKLLDGRDLLSIGNIVPVEIRVAIIKEVLKHMKRLYIRAVDHYNIQMDEYNKSVRERRRRRAMVARFSGKGIAKSQPVKTVAIASPPTRPALRIVLNQASLQKVMEMGKEHVELVREAWRPSNMSYALPSYDTIGLEVAKTQFDGTCIVRLDHQQVNTRDLADESYLPETLRSYHRASKVEITSSASK